MQIVFFTPPPPSDHRATSRKEFSLSSELKSKKYWKNFSVKSIKATSRPQTAEFMAVTGDLPNSATNLVDYFWTYFIENTCLFILVDRFVTTRVNRFHFCGTYELTHLVWYHLRSN